MMRQAGHCAVVATAGLLLVVSATASAGPERGRLLYENHCTGCHTSTVHVREQRKAKAPADVRAYIQRWSGELNLKWSTEELNDVYQHLNNQYYKQSVETPAK